jgi:hypothetical protein
MEKASYELTAACVDMLYETILIPLSCLKETSEAYIESEKLVSGI